MQADMMEEQEKLNTMVFKGSAGGGMAEVEVNGKLEITGLKIMPEAVDPEDVEMLEDMLLTTVNKAIADGQAIQQQEMSKITSGFNMPGMG